MMSCKRVSRLLSESMDRELSVWERIALRFHLAMCRLCGGFSEDLKLLREAARRHAQQIDDGTGLDDVTLPAEAHQRIKRLLKEQAS